VGKEKKEERKKKESGILTDGTIPLATRPLITRNIMGRQKKEEERRGEKRTFFITLPTDRHRGRTVAYQKNESVLRRARKKARKTRRGGKLGLCLICLQTLPYSSSIIK